MELSMAGIRFRSPILVASSECGSDVSFVERLVRRPVGAIVTKTFTSDPGHKIRVRPYQFPLRRLGRGYSHGDCLYSLAAPHVEDLEPWLAKVRRMAELCDRESVVLVASFFEDPEAPEAWADRARAFAAAGARMLELNFSCPHVARTFSRGSEATEAILERVKATVSTPVGVKIGPALEPLETIVARWQGLGLDFITAHNAPAGLVIDVEKEVPFGAPSLAGYAMGRTFLPYSLARVVRIRKATSLPVIGVGGIGRAEDLIQYLLCGTPLAGVGSALYFHGPELMDRLYQGLRDWMGKKGYGSVEDFLGKVFPLIRDPESLGRKERFPHTLPPECPYLPLVDPDSCQRCGRCARACIYGALSLDEETGALAIDGSRCWSCGFCVGLCPHGALTLVDREKRERIIWDNKGMARSFDG